jgi:type I restriction enzyme S subunit
MEELCEVVTDGTHDSPKLQEQGVPFIKGKHISGGKIDFSTCDFITQEDHEEACRRIKPRRGDILFSNIGSVGDTALVNDDREFSIKNVALFRPDSRKIDPRYLYYLVLSPTFREKLVNIRSGSAQPFISLMNLRAFEARYDPDRRRQESIASILSAYDDLIENNTKRIKILEEMARSLYRELFVNFRFPGHEKTKFINSKLGKIPEGWSCATIQELASTVDYGYTASASRESVGPKFLRITDIVPFTIDWQEVPHCAIEEEKVERYLLAEGDIVVARTGATTGYAKRLNKRHPPSVFASYLVRVRPQNRELSFFVGILMESDEYKEFIKRNLGGAAQPQANARVLTSFPLPVPLERVLTQFADIVEPLRDQSEILQHKNANLRATRDLLLPRLISGEIDVSSLRLETAAS